MPRVDLRITNDDGGVYTLSEAFEFQYLPPTIMSLSPTSGPITGGTTVTIIGTGFRPGVVVEFGGRPATVVSATETEIVCLTPSQL